MFVGSEFALPDTFSWYETNEDLQWMPKKKFEEKTGFTGNDLNSKYWDARDLFYAQRLIDVNRVNFNNNGYRFNLGKSENNLFSNKSAWDTLYNIDNYGGVVMAFDTETIGDFVGSFETPEAKIAGITEIGIAYEKFSGKVKAGNAKSITNPAGSFFFGIDSDQKAWLESVLAKKVRGETLTATEASAMERASRHSILGDTPFETFTDTWGKEGKQFTFVKRLNASRPDSIEDIRSGIDTMFAHYNPNREDQISTVVNHINGFVGKNKNRVVAGQNLAYDIGAIDRYSKLHNTSNLSSNFKYADTMFALRAYARANNMTQAEFLKMYNPRISNANLGSLEAIMEGITDNAEYSAGDAHTAIMDSLADLRALRNEGLNIIGNVKNLLDTIQEEPNSITLENSYVKINSKGNVRSTDIVVFGNSEDNYRVTTGYKVSNQYWQFEGNGSTNFEGITIDGKTIEGTSNRFIVKFSSANEDGATLIKSFENQADFEGWLRKHTSIVLKDQADVQLQTKMHDLDVARRVIDGFFDVGQVSQFKSGITHETTNAGGFASFQNYYSMYKDLASLSDEAVTSMKLVDASGGSITTAQGLLANINTGENINNIIEYADTHNIDSVVSHFRNSVRTQDKTKYTARDVAIRSYDERKVMQQAFDMFGNNSEFFEFANKELAGINNNLMQTIVFSDIQEKYLETADRLVHDYTYTADDLNTISILNKNGSSVRINVDDIDTGSSQLLRAFSSPGSTSKMTSDRLFEQFDDLQKRGLITNKETIERITNTHLAGKQPYALAQSIVTALHAETEDVRSIGHETAQLIREDRAYGMSIGDIAVNRGISESTIDKLIKKDSRTLMESSMSEIANASGTVSDSLREFTKSAIEKIERSTIVKGSLDDPKAQKQIRNELLRMGYDKESITQFESIFYEHGKTATNLARFNNGIDISEFNKTLGTKQEEITPIFFRTQNEEASAFMMFTRKRDYSRLVETLNNIGDTATDKQVQEAVKGMAGYYKISYLDILNLAPNDNNIIKQITGQDPRAVLVKQGENFYRYDTLSLNMYETVDANGNKVLHGGIRGQGGDALTSIRRNALTAYEAASYGEYDEATRLLNRHNIARMSDEASPQMGGSFTFGSSKLEKVRSVTQKDISYAYTIALDSGEDNFGLKELVKYLAQEENYAKLSDATPQSKQASTALRGIYRVFNDHYKFVDDSKSKGGITEYGTNKVFNSEQFQHFYQRYLTDQTGGIGSEQLIKDYLARGGDSAEYKALNALRDKSLLQILAQATQDNPNAGKDLYNTLNLLAENAGLDAVASESYAKHMRLYLGGYSPEMMNNNRLSGIMRPTYTQRMNYRSYRNDGLFFSDADYLQERLGIVFGDVYAPKQYLKDMRALDEGIHEKAGIKLTSETASQRAITGAVQSLSDAEIQAQKEASINYLMKNAGDLDKGVLTNVYNRMLNDISTYEGKAYIRPSLANQAFFSIGDPKTMRSSELEMISQLGTDAEKQATTRRLEELIGKKVENGTVIGYRLDPNNSEAFKPVLYRGQTVHKFTEQNAAELFETGKTSVITERQLEGTKIMVDEEKATAETFTYFASIDEAARSKEVIETLRSIGLDDQGSFTENVRILNRYTDAAYDALTFTNQTRLKTTVLLNNNINKHLTDLSISSKWKIIMSQYRGEEGYDALQVIANRVSYGNSTLASHLGYDELYKTVSFDNPTDTGSVGVLDNLITELRKSTDERAKTAVDIIDKFEKNDIALLSIQRQQMNTFQGQAFKMDQRVYQGLVMQADGDYTRGNGAQLAEYIRSHIQSGAYDSFENMGKVGDNADSILNKTWHEIVSNRRGTLKPHYETSMLLGVLDSVDYAQGNFDINTKNIVHVNVQDVLDNIPKHGGGKDAYSNFIFRVDGQDSRFMRALAQTGVNNANLDAASNSFYLDLSKFGKFNFGDQKGLTGVVLPFQYINTASDESVFVGESTKATMAFLNRLKFIDENNITDADKEISKALDKLFSAYAEELDPSNKQSLITKSFYKMKMPSSYGALAKDAIVPTANIEYDIFKESRDLRYKLNASLGANFNIKTNEKLINDFNTNLLKQKEAIKKQKDRVINTALDPVSELNITTDNEIYKQYLRSFDSNFKINRKIESAMVTSKQMFQNTSMDTGLIGHQIFADYFGGTSAGLTKYDSLSRFHRGANGLVYEASEFSISSKDITDFIENFTKTFDDTDHKAWAEETAAAMYRIIDGTKGTEFDRQNHLMRSLEARINSYMGDIEAATGLNLNETMSKALNRELTDIDRQDFVLTLNKAFEIFGDRYASEVGILGLTNRYPNFTEYGTLPVRIYLDQTLKGNEVRFLGPQFSILQNLDFDGDTEFLKFLGNGGLLAKDATESSLLKAQFEYMNGKNLNLFAESISDSIKAYRYGDETSFKAVLLEDLGKEKYYDPAVEKFRNALTKSDLEWFDSLEKDTKKLILSYTNQMKEAFTDFDEALGSSIKNADMVKAAIQARIAKNYIGNYSKPNLEIRNTLTYMINLAEGDELKELLQMRDVLFTLNNDGEKIGPGGLLTFLEQKGIDTKHIHDAASLNDSTSWRIGVKKLFDNANGAEKVNVDQRREALTDLVEGARKVFFSDKEYAGKSSYDIAEEILSKGFKDWYESVNLHNYEDENFSNLGKAYISGLYELSQKDNAYKGFFENLRAKQWKDIDNFIRDMSEDDIDYMLSTLSASQRSDLNMIAEKGLLLAARNGNRTDDVFMAFNRSIRKGDILLYQTDDGPIGYVFDKITGKGTKQAVFYEYDLNKGIRTDVQHKIGHAITIKDLNEQIKKNGNASLLDFSRLDVPEKNINEIYINDIRRNTASFDANIRTNAAITSMESRIQDLFDSIDDADIINRIDIARSQKTVIDSYSARSLGDLMAEIIGTDSAKFVSGVKDLEERIQYGLDNRMLSMKNGSTDAKELMRAINKEIAANPRPIISDETEDTVINYLSDHLNKDVYINNEAFLTRSVSEIKLSNEIASEVNKAINTRNANLEEFARKFYIDVTNGVVDENEAFVNVHRAWQNEIDNANRTIRNAIERSTNKPEEMLRVFGWSDFKNTDFIIDLKNAKIDRVDALHNSLVNSRIGYGQFTGVRLGDLTETQKGIVSREVTDALDRIKDINSLDYIAARNTQELLKTTPGVTGVNALDFSTSDTLITSYKKLFNPDVVDTFADQAAQESLNEAAAKAAREAAEGVEKKTLLKSLKNSFDLSPNAGKYLKIGAGVAAGVATLGIAGHALFNNNSNNGDVEVPSTVEREIKQQGGRMRPPKVINNKNDLKYENAPSDAQTNLKHRRIKIAPPSLPKNRTIYHDAGSGFNFKVSAQSYNKLQDEAYHKMANRAGLNSNNLHVTRDNSRITDNWLENKFAQLME